MSDVPVEIIDALREGLNMLGPVPTLARVVLENGYETELVHAVNPRRRGNLLCDGDGDEWTRDTRYTKKQVTCLVCLAQMA